MRQYALQSSTRGGQAPAWVTPINYRPGDIITVTTMSDTSYILTVARSEDSGDAWRVVRTEKKSYLVEIHYDAEVQIAGNRLHVKYPGGSIKSTPIKSIGVK